MDWLSSLPHGRPHVHVNASEESLFLGVLLKDDPTDHSCIQLHVGETLLSINWLTKITVQASLGYKKAKDPG